LTDPSSSAIFLLFNAFYLLAKIITEVEDDMEDEATPSALIPSLDLVGLMKIPTFPLFSLNWRYLIQVVF